MKHRIQAESIAVVVILIIAILCNIYIWKDDDITGRYDWSVGTEIPDEKEAVPFREVSQIFTSDRGKLIALELLFRDVPEDSDHSLSLMIRHGESLIYQSTIPLSQIESDSWYQLYTNITIAEGDEYEIVLTADEDIDDALQIYLVDADAAASESSSCVVDGAWQQGSMLIRYGYLQTYSRKDKLIRSMMTLVIALLMAALFARRKEHLTWSQCQLTALESGLSESAQTIFSVGTEILLCCILTECSGLDLQTPVKIALCFLSLVAGFCWHDSRMDIKSRTTAASSKAAFGAVIVLAAFALVGSNTLVYPLDAEVTFVDLLIFLIAMIWFIPVVALFLKWYERIPLFSAGRANRQLFILVAAVLLLAAPCLALYAFNPGISGYDTVMTMAYYAHNIYGMENWHPPFYVMLLRMILAVWDSTYAVILVQLAFWAFVVIESLLLLCDLGWDQRFLLLVAFLLSVNQANYLHIISIFKDVPYAISLLWLTVLIARRILIPQVERKWGIYLEFVIALVLIFFLRQNGMVVYVLAILFLAVSFKKDRRLLTSLALSIALILFIRFPVYSYYDVQETSDTANGGMYIGLGQDIMAVYYSGGRLSDESMEIVRVLSSDDMGQFSFDPYRADSSYDLTISIVDFIRNYIETFLNNPVIMTREILLRQDCVWNLFSEENCDIINFYDAADAISLDDAGSMWLEYYPSRNTNAWTYTLIEAQDDTVDNQLLRTLVWSAGIYTLLVLFAALSLILRNCERRNWLIFLPFAGQIVSLLLTTGWNDFRYYWPLNLMALLIVMLVPTMKRDAGTGNESCG